MCKSIYSFREKKQYERASSFKQAQKAHCRQNRLLKGSSSTPPKRMVLINVKIMERDNYSILKSLKHCTTALVNSQENQAQIMKNQTPHNTN